METTPPRTLAVILHADVVGSTGFVHRSEALAHERIQDAFRRFSTSIEHYGGISHELRGDALVAEFGRASDAVSAALAFQSANAEFNAALGDDIRPEVRIGISMGEVVIADHTVTGAGVVLAQRLEQMARPGGVCIQGAVYETLPQHLPFVYESLGERSVKGFEEPVRCFAVALAEEASVPQPESRHLTARTQRERSQRRALTVGIVALIGIGAASIVWWQSAGMRDQPVDGDQALSPVQEKPSIAVLPFANMSGQPEQEYFADGMTDDLITDLSKISGLFVIARNSSFAYKGQSHDLRLVARELSVRYVLEGSVRRAGDQVRVNAQLIDASTGGHLWAERFDGPMSDVFALQDNINREIVAVLAVKLTGEDRERLNKTRTVSSDAYDVLLQGLELLQRFNPEDNLAARELFKKAAALDPDYARAYANVAWSYSTDVNFNWTDDPEEAIRLGLDYAEQAAALDEDIPQIHLTRSLLYAAQRQHDAAVVSARRTVELYPNYADGHATLAFVSLYAGEPQDTLQAIRSAKRLNPRSSYIYLAIEAHAHSLLGQYERALPLYEEALQRNPGFDRGHLQVAAIYGHLGKTDDAAWALEEALSIRPDITLAGERRGARYRRP